MAIGPDQKLYAVGGVGNEGDCLTSSECFDFEKGTWEALPEMSEKRRALAVVTMPDGIYAIGGYDGQKYLASVEKFDLLSHSWQPIKSMATARCTLAATTSSDCQFIYVLGGYNG